MHSNYQACPHGVVVGVCNFCVNDQLEEEQRNLKYFNPRIFFGIDPAVEGSDRTSFMYTCTEHNFRSDDHGEFLKHIDDHHQENRHAKTDD